MALQLNVDTQFGITANNAYAKISSFSGTKDCIVIVVDYFATQAARDAGNPVIKNQAFQWNREDMAWTGVTDSDALVSELYDYLKTLPEFADATDV